MVRLFVGVFTLSLCILKTAWANPEGAMGHLEMIGASGQKQTALLLDTKITGDVDGMIAVIQVEQAFTNQSSEWMHGRYVFPLPAMAAVSDLEIQIGERIIRGEVQEKIQAQKNFAAAKKAGKKAGLLEQHRANLFSVNVANLAPGEKIITRLSYVDRVQFSNDLFELRLPTTLTPRYITGQPLPTDEHKVEFNPRDLEVHGGWAAATDNVPDAPEITPPQAHSLLPADSHQFSLSLKVNPGLATNGVLSPSHAIRNQHEQADALLVELNSGTAPLDRDLVLHWQARDAANTQAAFFQQTINHDDQTEYYSMVMVTPPQVGIQALPRDVTFVIDTSGSMGGTSIQQAKKALLQALSHLDVNDRFNVIEFNSRFTTLYGKSQYATPNNLLAAQRLVMRLEAGGGTEMAGPLSFAMQNPAEEGVLKQIVFITDGSVGNEAELLGMIKDQLGEGRLFTVAIGSAPNNFFMRKAASFGRGIYLNINKLSEVSEKIEQLSRRIQQPVMQNIRVDWPFEVEQYPQKLPDLYAGEPLVLIAKSDRPVSEVSVNGELQGQTWRQRLKNSTHNQALDMQRLNTVWARSKVEELMDSLLTSPEQADKIRLQVIELGLRNQLATKFTSFIAVEQEISRPESATPKHSNVPNLMPKGSTMNAPQTATPATILQLVGGILLLLVLFWQSGPGFRWPAEIA